MQKTVIIATLAAVVVGAILAYVVVSSSCDCAFCSHRSAQTGFETSILPADENGIVSSWEELRGSRQVAVSPKTVLRAVGYAIVEEKPRITTTSSMAMTSFIPQYMMSVATRVAEATHIPNKPPPAIVTSPPAVAPAPIPEKDHIAERFKRLELED